MVTECGGSRVPRPSHPVAATVYYHLGIDARQVAIPDLAGRPRYLVEEGERIAELTA